MAHFNRVVLLALCMALAGCGGRLDKPGLAPAYVTCPRPKPYPRAFLKQAAAERVNYADKVPALVTLSNDYGALRQALRDCGAVPVPAK